jgi:TolB-like protein
MTDPSTAHSPEPEAAAHDTVWQRLQRHKVLQWTLAYAAAAYTVLHATQMVVESFEWPHLIVRVVTLGLVMALPVVVLLAWYHGHKAQHRFSTAELSILTVLLLIAGTLMWGFTQGRQPAKPVPIAGPPSQVPPVGQPVASVAVVPFVNLTGDPSKEYFSDGMAEELIDALANVPGLKVPSRTSSFAYKGRDTDVRRIAQDLGVAKILEGSVRSAGDTVRVTAQLVDAQSGYHVWSQTYERRFADIFKLQDELAKAIVEQLLGKIGTASANSGISSPSTRNVEAYQLYLQAGALDAIATLPSMHRGIELLDQALTLDPAYAEAWAARARMRAALVGFLGASPHELQQAEYDARRTEALRPNSGQTVLALIHDQLGRWVDAEREYQAALATVDRTNPLAHLLYSAHLGATGRLQAGLVEATEAYRLAPSDHRSIGTAGVANLLVGHDTEALKFADLLTELGDPRHSADFYRGMVALRRGHLTDEALAGLTTWGYVGRDARSALGNFIVRAAADPTTATPEARKALDEMYGYANRIDEHHSLGPFPVEMWLPEMRQFRRDARFQRLVTRLGLIDYWRQYGPPDDCDLHGDVLVCR